MKKTLAKILCGVVLVPTALFGCNGIEKSDNNPIAEAQGNFYVSKERIDLNCFRYRFEDDLVVYVRFDGKGSFKAGPWDLSIGDPLYIYDSEQNTATAFSFVPDAPYVSREWDGTLVRKEGRQKIKIIDAGNDGTVDNVLWDRNKEMMYYMYGIDLIYDKEKHPELYELGTTLYEKLRETLRIPGIEKEAANFEFPQSSIDLDNVYLQFDEGYRKAAEEKVKEILEAEKEEVKEEKE